MHSPYVLCVSLEKVKKKSVSVFAELCSSRGTRESVMKAERGAVGGVLRDVTVGVWVGLPGGGT